MREHALVLVQAPTGLVVVIAAMLLCACGGGDHKDEVHSPSNADERAAARVFAEFTRALVRDDPVAACSYATAKAYATFDCDGEPRLPAKLRGPLNLGSIVVRDATGYEADLHLSAPLVGDRRSNLVLLFKRHERHWRVSDALTGGYG